VIVMAGSVVPCAMIADEGRLFAYRSISIEPRD
jgi:hypothetical protein